MCDKIIIKIIIKIEIRRRTKMNCNGRIRNPPIRRKRRVTLIDHVRVMGWVVSQKMLVREQVCDKIIIKIIIKIEIRRRTKMNCNGRIQNPPIRRKRRVTLIDHVRLMGWVVSQKMLVREQVCDKIIIKIIIKIEIRRRTKMNCNGRIRNPPIRRKRGVTLIDHVRVIGWVVSQKYISQRTVCMASAHSDLFPNSNGFSFCNATVKQTVYIQAPKEKLIFVYIYMVNEPAGSKSNSRR